MLNLSVHLNYSNCFDRVYDELKLLSKDGFLCYPFKIGWYNEKANHFSLPYGDDAVAFLVISKPDMFEKTFIPYVKTNLLSGLKDPIDECMTHYFSKLKESFSNLDAEVIHDFEIFPNRKPKALFQTAAHVSGAAYFYQRCNVKNDPWPKNKKIFGVCLHPVYGGWFAMRAIIVFPKLKAVHLPAPLPCDVLNSEKMYIDLLEKYNFHWQDWSFRDVIQSPERYSPLQQKYFSTQPKDRMDLLKEIVQFTS